MARHVRSYQRVAVALSGGIDSVCLLHVLATARKAESSSFQLSALHVHHGLSPYADQWASFSLELCEELQVPCKLEFVCVELNAGDGLEAAARRARHTAFAEADEDWLMLAHQRDDQAETLLFNLLRGTGLAGAAAMRERNGRLLRPILGVGRDEIQRYALVHGLKWCEDESNADIGLSRNFLRKRIFPDLSERFPAARDNFAKAAARFGEANDLLDDLARHDLPTGSRNFPLNVAHLGTLSEPRGRNVLRYLLSINHVQIPSEAKLREAMRQMLSAAQDRHPVVIFGDHCLCRRRGWIYLEPVATCDDNS